MAKQQTHHPETVAAYPAVLVQIQPSASSVIERKVRYRVRNAGIGLVRFQHHRLFWKASLRGRQTVPKTVTMGDEPKGSTPSLSVLHPKFIEVNDGLPSRRERVQFSPGALFW